MKILGDGDSILGADGKRRGTYRVECDCGAIFIVRKYAVHSGNTKSCGCLRRVTTAARGRANLKLGISTDPAMIRTYSTWRSMLGRCYSPTNASYQRYGAVGVKATARWHKFKNFYADMGSRPGKEYSLDRKDNTKGYMKSNCRWATRKQQARNRTSSVFITHNGKTRIASEWAVIYGLSLTTILRRHKRGIPIDSNTFKVKS